VSSLRELYRQFRQLIHEGFKFLVIGAIGAILTFGVANLLDSIGKYKAITIATIVATIVTYLGNKYWSFRHRESHSTARDTTLFLIFNGIGLVIYYACIWLIQDVAGLSGKGWYNVALVVGTGLGTLFRFWSYRKWVWTAADPGALQADAPAVENLSPDQDGQGSPPSTGPRHRAPAGRR
jgi:putative flippase GtrA